MTHTSTDGSNLLSAARLGSGSTWRRRLAAVAGLALIGSGLTYLAPPTPAVAAPGTVVYLEDFQNHNVSVDPVAIGSYQGASEARNSTYTADLNWNGTKCNGWIVNGNSTSAPAADSCIANASNFKNVKEGATAIGMARGETQAIARGNNAYTAWTAVATGAGVMLRSQQTIPMVQGRYYNFQATLGVAIERGNPPSSNCQVDAPLITLRLTDGANAFTLADQMNPCLVEGTRQTPTGSTYPWWVAPLRGTALRWSGGPTAAIEMRNDQGGGNGNDSVFDDAVLVDVTPTLSKAFSPTSAGVGQVVDLIFTITNTDELGVKSDWSFTDNLDSVLTRADSFVGGTCSGMSATGTTAVAIAGDLPEGMPSCTVVIHVVSSAKGPASNGRDNLDPVSGVIPPPDGDDVTLDVVNPTLQVVKALAANRVHDSDQFTVEIADGATVVNSTANSTTTGIGSTVDPGSGDTGVYEGLTTKTYVLREVPTGTAAGRYGSSVTCVDSSGLQSGLPSGLAASSVSITPVAGAVITCTFTNTPLSTSMAFDKQVAAMTDVDGDGLYDVGDTINYRFVVTNTGQRVLSNVVVTDPGLGAVSCPSTTLAAGTSMTCTSVVGHVVVQAPDLNTGSFSNSASVSATEPGGDAVGPVSDSETVALPGTVELELVKRLKAGSPVDLNANGKVDAGDTIVWEFEVSNTGSPGVTVHEVTVADPFLAAAGVSVTCPDGDLDPGDSVTCTSGVYSIPQALLDSDSLTVANTATASAKDPQENSDSSPISTTSTALTKDASLVLTKSVSPTTVAAAGGQVTYSFAVENTGTLTVTGLIINEIDFGGTGSTASPTCLATTLAPGASTTCSMTYAATQLDVDAAEVANTATASATDSLGVAVTSNESSASFTAPPAPAMTLQKTGTWNDVNADGVANVGDTVSYTFEVRNTGNVTLTDPTLGDSLLDAAGITITCPPGPILPNGVWTCTSDSGYELTQDHVDAGAVYNSATVSATDPSGSPVSVVGEGETPLVAAPGLELVKSGSYSDVDGDDVNDAGDTITYTFLVRNVGNVSVSALGIDDQFLTVSGVGVTCPLGTIAPGDLATCEADAPYVITQADVDTGGVHNEATAVGADPAGGSVESPPSSFDTPLAGAPGLSLEKTAAYHDANGSQRADAGDTISYRFQVTNLGNRSVPTPTITDPLLVAAGIGVTCAEGMVAPAQSVMCWADRDYVITQADVEAGGVHNEAMATSQDGSEEITSQLDAVDVSLAPLPSLSLSKSGTLVDANHTGRTDLGDLIGYQFKVTNTGNVAVAKPVVTDELLADAGIGITCPDGQIAAGASIVCTANAGYVITADDVAAGKVTNTASVSAERSGVVVAGASDTVETDLTDLPFTGAGLASAGLAGIVLVAGGVLLFVARRRRGGLA